jgi:hypothetical protein
MHGEAWPTMKPGRRQSLAGDDLGGAGGVGGERVGFFKFFRFFYLI